MTEFTPWIGVSTAVRLLEDELRQAARTDARTLLTGESGVGKDVAARLIHHHSARAHQPFVAMNCAGIPDSLLESELFGHERGSFTGAYRNKPGLLELGHGGTMFLDEIGEMSPRMQALLLRFLEDGSVQRVGAERPSTAVDVRIIAATNRVLIDRVAQGRFREDLYYRLNVIHLVIPPLRERRDDIVPLLDYYLQYFAARYRVPVPVLTAEALALLHQYGWPGNVRELMNLTERAIARCRGEFIGAADLELPSPPPAESVPASATGTRTERQQLYDRIVHRRESFWSAVYEPFMLRDLTRADLRALITEGLRHTRGSYRGLVDLFHLDPDEYKRLLHFLRKHHCHVTPRQIGDLHPPRPPGRKTTTSRGALRRPLIRGVVPPR